MILPPYLITHFDATTMRTQLWGNTSETRRHTKIIFLSKPLNAYWFSKTVSTLNIWEGIKNNEPNQNKKLVCKGAEEREIIMMMLILSF